MQQYRIVLSLLYFLCFISLSNAQSSKENVLISTYYFGGWAGKNSSSGGWDKNAPSHATERLEKEFPDRKPVWGWRDDSDKIMKKQINLASKNGIDCFFFCWYWSDDKSSINLKSIENTSLHDCIYRFMRSKNNSKIKFAMMIANHGGFKIYGKENWIEAIDFMSKHYFNHPSYLKFDGKPVISVFSARDMFPYMDEMRQAAIRNGFPGLYIIALGDHGDLGADAFGWYNIREREPGTLTERKYAEFTNYVEKCWYNNPRLYPVVMSGWDKRPWDWRNNSLYYAGRTPELFGKHLSKAYDFLKKCTLDHKMIMIYAWNELGEGGYLLPTAEDPKCLYLREIRKIKREHKH